MVKKIVGFKILILPLAVAFAIMFAVLFVKPAYDSMTTAKSGVAAGTQQLENVRAQNSKLAELKSKWEIMEEKKMVQTALPESDNIDNYMAELYERVSRSGVLLTKFDAVKSVSSENASYVCGTIEGASVAANAGVAVATPADSAEASIAAAPLTPNSCANAAVVSLSVAGSWEQVLGFFKYLEETNRLANISKISIQSKEQSGQEGGTSDLLDANITLNVFFKPKSEKTDTSAITSLASGGRFSEESLKKLKKVVQSVFEEPGVSEVSERNIFK